MTIHNGSLPNPSGPIHPEPVPTVVNQMLVQAYAAAPPQQKDRMIAQLIGKLYKDAPLLTRDHLLTYLIQPLSLLSLMAVADGIFAKIRFRSGWPDLRVQLEEASKIQVSDVVALADYVQQVSVQAVDNLVGLIAGEPMMAGSAAAAVLVTVLMMRAKNRRADDSREPDFS